MNGGAEEASTESDIVTANMNKTNENDDEGEHVEVEVGEVQENYDCEQNGDEIDNENTDEVDISEVEILEGGQENYDEQIGEEVNAENIDKEPCVVASGTTVSIPDVIPVFCTASLENCPDSQLSDEYCQSIRRFLGSEQHLLQNISSSELQHVSTRSLRNNLYTHTLSIVVFVKTAKLWESPASYLRKHLGLTNYWTRSNGTIVRLSRIHQK